MVAVAAAFLAQILFMVLCVVPAARAWREPCVLLHVKADNTSAQQMYSSCGFAAVPNSQGFSGLIKGPWTRQRMVADSAAMTRNYFKRTGCSGSSSSSSDVQEQFGDYASGKQAVLLQ